MTPGHRVVTRAFDDVDGDDEPPRRWKCAGCSAKFEAPSDAAGEWCPASGFFDEAA